MGPDLTPDVDLVMDLVHFGGVTRFNVHQAKTHLSRLLQRVAAGEEVVIARGDRPVAKLVPVDPPTVARRPGTGKGEIWIADDFDAPLPGDLLDQFEGRRTRRKRR
jgi:prevent-host-death family protein